MSRGEYQVLEIEDQGTGIPGDQLPYLFDPYYTTKEMGTGTGLGLALVHSIVEEEEGLIQVRSREKEGTTFTIILPSGKE